MKGWVADHASRVVAFLRKAVDGAVALPEHHFLLGFITEKDNVVCKIS